MKISMAVLVVSIATAATAQQASDQLTIAGPAHAPVTLKLADLKAMPHTTVKFHNAHTNTDETYSGIRVADLLARVNTPLGKDLHREALESYVTATGADGYKVALSLAEADPSFHNGEVVVADSQDGKPLDAKAGPLKLVVTDDKDPARQVRNLVRIELKK